MLNELTDWCDRATWRSQSECLFDEAVGSQDDTVEK